MTNLEKHLIKIGFQKLVKEKDSNRLIKTKKRKLSIDTPSFFYFKENIGLFEFGLIFGSPTLIWPRPGIKVYKEKIIVDGVEKVSIEDETYTSAMNLCLSRQTPEEILDAINNNLTFVYNAIK